MNLKQLRHIRWAVRAVLVVGVAASVVANILHAHPNPISQTIAGWPPLALLITIELVSRVPMHRQWLANVRRVGTTTIALIAAWVSYWHMAGVAGRYGETGAAPFLLPLSVDGLVVVASVSLVELAGRIRDAAEVLPAVVEPPAQVEESPDKTLVKTPTPEPAPRRTGGRPSAATKVAKAAAKMPDAPPDKIAARAKVSERTVRRHLAAPKSDAADAEPTSPDKAPANGRVPELTTT